MIVWSSAANLRGVVPDLIWNQDRVKGKSHAEGCVDTTSGSPDFPFDLAGFCVEALEEARTRHGQPEIFNTDQGHQFTGFAFTGRLRAPGVQISMDGRGRCMDNIFIERLWRSLKYEAVYLHDLADGFQARRVIGEWSDFYNADRPHSALGGKTPAEAYRGDPPADMMDKRLRALPTYPQAQQRRQEDRSKEILAR